MSLHWTESSPGWILRYEEAFLQALSSTLLEGARAVNIGGAVGTSSSAILRGAYSLEDFQLVSIDIEECHKELETLAEQGLPVSPPRFMQVVEDSVEFGKRQTKEIDLVFVDGDHTEKHTLEDIKTYAKLLKPGGLLICHDYGDPAQKGVTAAIDRWLNYKRGGGKDWVKLGQVLFTIAFMKPGDMEWAKGRIK